MRIIFQRQFYYRFIFVAVFAFVAREREFSREARDGRKERNKKEQFYNLFVFVAFFASVARGVFLRSTRRTQRGNNNKKQFYNLFVFVAFFASVAREKEISREVRNARKEGITIKNSFIIYLFSLRSLRSLRERKRFLAKNATDAKRE